MSDDIYKEIEEIEVLDSNLHKIKLINETFSDIYEKNKQVFDTNLQHTTDVLKNKLKQNNDFSTVVNNYVNKFVSDDSLKEQAKDEMFLILTGEILGIYRGISHTTCTIS